jgi:hypothetical protein
MMIRVNKGSVELTEGELKEILREVEKVKEVHKEFTADPFPDHDMTEAMVYEENLKRGKVTIRSPYSGIDFVIRLVPGEQECERMGYKWVDPEDLKKSETDKFKEFVGKVSERNKKQ